MQPYICFVQEEDFFKKNKWLTVLPVLSYDAPSMSWCFTAVLFTSHEVPEGEKTHSVCCPCVQQQEDDHTAADISATAYRNLNANVQKFSLCKF